jgi:hypothetical protein
MVHIECYSWAREAAVRVVKWEAVEFSVIKSEVEQPE